MTREKHFPALLLKWNEEENDRSMPWKNENNPYRIWISEIILQQTRVQQGMKYYVRFINKFPSVFHLSKAKEPEVFKLWEGLGYYSRCKNIILSARYIAEELNGIFPEKFEDILKLKGIGSYTASAIASFAYNQPYAVLDGNVFRVLSRVFGIKSPIDSSSGKKIFSELSQQLLDKKQPGIYNQAMMDLGAVICKPQLPLCTVCPMIKICYAFKNNEVESLPVKNKKITRKERWMYYLLVSYQNKLYVRKRIQKDIWQNLFEFILVEPAKATTLTRIRSGDFFKNVLKGIDFTITDISGVQSQILTHQVIKGLFICITISEPLPDSGYILVSKKQLKALPFPKFITAYLKD